jgi:hypothetical protein
LPEQVRREPPSGPPAGPPPAWPPEPPGAQLRGRVRGHGNVTLPGATVTLVDAAGAAAAHTASGPGGEFLLTARAGDYLLVAASTGHEPIARYHLVGVGGADADIRLRGAVRLSGQVTGPDGGPLAGAVVSLVDPDGDIVAVARTGTDGRYAVDDLVGGAYTLAVTGAARPAVAVRVDLPASGDAEHDVALLPGARVYGTARDEQWRPLAGIRVALLDSRGAAVVEAFTDRTGAYAFTDLREGLYTVVATGYPPVTATLQVERGQQHEYDVALHY